MKRNDHYLDMVSTSQHRPEVQWCCPHCGDGNIDYPKLTMVPECRNCHECVEWWDAILFTLSDPLETCPA
ncbi:unnamed protein product [marine sediment metagenome]|uniref:Uncharacterized protein n=1 Tax=marine sediment metagenome TaxID=412755 RepID=X1FGJ4_9ZZZZ